MKQSILYLAIALLVLGLTGCDVKNGVVADTVDLPTDSNLNLYSADEGIYPNTDVLNDPANPFAKAALNSENVWTFNDNCPSAQSKFYLWATYMVSMPTGECQYMTAKALHEIYTVTGSENARQQAIRAYHSTLDHFFDSVTWWKAWWINDDTYYAVTIRNLIGEAMYDPSDLNLLSLYDDPALALADLSEWGYVYDSTTKTITKVK
jgi:hypothetical protein